jgi:phosphoglycerol transferase MdoB-like AlkP superfamily enzyme
MISTTTKFYTSEDKFATYYITVSGHAPYNFGGGNSTALRYQELVKDLPYSTSIKAYLASQIELDRALEQLINKLEKANVLDDTVIAVVGDHYPYTIDINEINSISSYKRDEIVEVNRSNFIIWNNKMKKAVQVDKVGSQIDVLPTLLNLFDIEYDSRLIIGNDILSNNEGIAIFSDRSWVSDFGTYFAAEGKFVEKENTTVEEGYADRINREVSNKFTMSNLFIKHKIYEKLVK